MNARRKICLVVFVGVVIAAAASQAFPQGFLGTIRGEVRDSSGAVVPGAAVTVTNDGTGETRSQLTTSSGMLNIASLLVGEYTVTVEMSGFRRHVQRGVEVNANQVSVLLVNLEVGKVTETIEVVGSQLVQTETATLVGATFNRQVTDLPIPSRTGNPLNLAILVPGTTSQPGGVAGTGGSVGGNRPRQNNFVVDGLDNNEPVVTGPVSPVIQESVQEFTLLTNQFTAEYGHSTGGQFIIVTKSGSNEPHGGGWWNIQNRHLSALDNITRANPPPEVKPRFDWNRFGGQLGGPIVKDKWFSYAAYEYRNLTREATSSGQILVPTSAGLRKLKSLAADSASGISPINVGILANHVPAATAETTATSVLNEATGEQVSIPLGVFSATTPNFTRAHTFLINQDVVTPKHRLSFRFNYSRIREIGAGELPVPAFNSNTFFDTRRVSFTDVTSITPGLINEFRASYLRSSDGRPVDLPAPPGSADVFGNYGIIDLSLFIGPQGDFPQFGGNNIWQFVNQTSWVRGAHTIKGGVDIRNIISFRGFLPRARGEYVWTDLDSFTRDTFPTFFGFRGVGLENFAQNRAAIYWFLQDSWKVRPGLALELGLRYEYTQPARDSNLQDLNGIASIPSFTDHPVFDTLPRQHREALLGHLGPGIVFRRPLPDTNNWAPRIGLAWDILGDGKTSFRAGFGIAHDVIFGNLSMFQVPPQTQVFVTQFNACAVSPAPGWCNLNTGFIEGGAIFSTLPGGLATDPAVARAFTPALALDEKVPETYTWSASLQRELFSDWIVEARYVGNHAIHLPVQRWANAGVPAPFRLPIFIKESDALAANLEGAPTLLDFKRARNPLLFPFGFGGPITMWTPDGQSWYHGGSINVQKRMSRGLYLSINYTFSRTIDVMENELFSSSMNPRRPMNHLNIFEGKALSGLHRQHKFTVAWVWELPKYKGASAFLHKALDGWQFNGMYLAESGQPLTITSGRDVNGDFDTAGDTAYFNPDGRPNTGTDVNFVCSDGGVNRIATRVGGCGGDENIVAYVAQDPTAQYIRGELGMVTNLGRNTFLSPGINTWNLAIVKDTPFWGEGRVLQFRVELWNAFNHPSFIIGNGSVFQLLDNARGFPGYVTPGTSQFLDKTIFSGGLGQAPFQRVIQFGLKLIF